MYPSNFNLFSILCIIFTGDTGRMNVILIHSVTICSQKSPKSDVECYKGFLHLVPFKYYFSKWGITAFIYLWVFLIISFRKSTTTGTFEISPQEKNALIGVFRQQLLCSIHSIRHFKVHKNTHMFYCTQQLGCDCLVIIYLAQMYFALLHLTCQMFKQLSHLIQFSFFHLSLKWTIETLSTISIMSVNGPFER